MRKEKRWWWWWWWEDRTNISSSQTSSCCCCCFHHRHLFHLFFVRFGRRLLWSFFAKTRRERASDGKTVLQMWAVCVVAIDSIIKRARVQSSKHDDDDATFQSRKNNARLVFLSPFRFFFFFILTNIQPRRTQRIKPNRRKSILTFRLRSYCSFQTRNLGFVRSQRLVCRWIWTLTWMRRTPGSSSLLASL